MLSPDDIAGRRFLVALRGYDRDEVATFLQEVATEVRGLRARVAELQADLARETSAARSVGGDTRSALQALGEETTRILVAAEESAREIESKASTAAQARRERADRDARETTERANRQAARTIAEAERRRDAVAAEIASLGQERDRFVDGLRASVASIGGVVGELSPGQVDTEAADDAVTAEAAPEEVADPADPDGDTPTGGGPAGAVVAPGPAHPGVVTTTDPVLLEDEPEVAIDAAHEAAPVGTVVEAEAEQVEAPAATGVEGRRDEALAQVRPGMLRQCKRGLQEIQNEVLASIRDHGTSPELDDLLPGEHDLDGLGDVASEHLGHAYRRALDDAASQADGDPPTDLADGARVHAAVATFRAVLAHEVTSALRATLRAGLEAEEAQPQLSERVGEVFRDLRGPVIESTVTEHLQRTYGHGLLDAWEQLGVARVAWQAVGEPRCPEGRCRTNASEGPLELGQDFPSGDRVPPAHPGCLCVVVPVA